MHGKRALHIVRPDQPRVRNSGKVIKYEFPTGSKMILDVPPSCYPFLADPNTPLWVTEGSKKADAAASQGLCCIALLGVWNWKGTNQYGGKTVLPDWESIALNS